MRSVYLDNNILLLVKDKRLDNFICYRDDKMYCYLNGFIKGSNNNYTVNTFKVFYVINQKEWKRYLKLKAFI